MKVRWTTRARDDLLEIGRYIAADRPEAARRWVDRLRARARKVSQFPRAGSVVPEFGRDDIREVIVGRYRLVYRVARREIHILAVFEGHRLMPLEGWSGEESHEP